MHLARIAPLSFGLDSKSIQVTRVKFRNQLILYSLALSLACRQEPGIMRKILTIPTLSASLLLQGTLGRVINQYPKGLKDTSQAPI